MASPSVRRLETIRPGIVVDASIVLKLLLPERESDTIRALWGEWLASEIEIVAPVLLAYEVISVLRNKVHRGELPAEAGEAALAAFQAQEIPLLHPEGIEGAAWSLAMESRLPTAYDAIYLALADHLDYDFWTADRRLATAVGKRAPRLHLITGQSPRQAFALDTHFSTAGFQCVPARGPRN